MAPAPAVSYWQELQGGLRPSSFLKYGGLLVWLSAGLNIADNALFRLWDIDSLTLFLAAWIGWLLSLTVLAAAFSLIGYRPFMTGFGWIVGIFHLGQAVDLFLTLFSGPGLTFAIDAVALAKYITLLIFAVVERKKIGRRMCWFLGSVAALEVAKIATRVSFSPPELVSLTGDVLLLIALGWAVFRLRHSVRDQEEHWAKKRLAERSASFEDFDNP